MQLAVHGEHRSSVGSDRERFQTILFVQVDRLVFVAACEFDHGDPFRLVLGNERFRPVGRHDDVLDPALRTDRFAFELFAFGVDRPDASTEGNVGRATVRAEGEFSYVLTKQRRFVTALVDRSIAVTPS